MGSCDALYLLIIVSAVAGVGVDSFQEYELTNITTSLIFRAMKRSVLFFPISLGRVPGQQWPFVCLNTLAPGDPIRSKFFTCNSTSIVKIA
jgi:hypothetical protein